MLVKVHESYRKIIAVCDEELLGKKFIEGKLQLDVKESFYNGESMNEDDLVLLLQEADKDDATFSFVGEKSIKAGIKANVINKKGVMKVQGIPHALGLL